MRVSIDADRCIASGACVIAAPEVFEQDEDGIAFVREAEPPPERHASVREAVSACPTMAITITTPE